MCTRRSSVRTICPVSVGPTPSPKFWCVNRSLPGVSATGCITRICPDIPTLCFRVHGCFWHGHGCHLFRWPESNREFWRGKIGGNMARDARTREELLALGWRVLTVWECALKGTHRLPADEVAIRCEHWLWSGLQQAEIAGSAAGGEEATICNV